MSTSPVVAASYPAIVGAILLAKRKELSLSQAEMADAVGLNVSTWSRVENGDSALTIEQLVSAATALNVPPSSILEASELKIEELKVKGITTGANRADLAAIAAMGAIPLVGSALVAALGLASVFAKTKAKDK